MNEFEKQLKACPFFQQAIAELLARQAEQTTANEQALAMIATACARQLDAALLVQNLERMEALFAQQAPNAVRSAMIQTTISLIQNSGRKADLTPPATH